MTSSITTPDGVSIIPDQGDARVTRARVAAALSESKALGVIVATIALAIALIAVPNWPVGVRQDDGIYAVLGKAIASGEGYRYLNLPGAPYATHFPPGYPLFLALLWKISPEFPQNVALFTFANAALLSVAAYATFRFARARLALSPLGAAVVSIAGTVSLPALIFGVFVLSEPMFMAALLPLLYYAEQCAESDDWRRAIYVGLAGGALAMIRTNGMFVVPAFALVLLFRRRFLGAACAMMAAAVFMVPWKMWVSAHGADVAPVLMGKYGPYDKWLTTAISEHGPKFVWDVIVRNVRALYDLLWATFTGGETSPKFLHVPAAFAAVVVLTLGAWRLMRRAPVTAWFLAAYMALLMIWPFQPTRFIWALLPLFAAMLALGIGFILELKPRDGFRIMAQRAALAACAALVLGFGYYNVTGIKHGWLDAVPRAAATRATPVVEWVRQATRPTDIIAMEDDALVYLYTGRQGIPLGTFTPEEYLNEQTHQFAGEQLGIIVRRYKPTYVIGTTTYGIIAAKSLSARTPPVLQVVGTLPTAAIFAPAKP